MKIKWLGHASFKISGSKTIYIDPWKIRESDKADLILITHSHFDHFSPKDIHKIQAKETVVVGPMESLGNIKAKTHETLPGKSFEKAGIKIETFRSFNKNKTFHPKINKWLSYRFTMDDRSVFHTGDSDLIDDFKEIKTDLLLVPVSGHYVMDENEAALLANTIKPQLAIPMHWGDIIGELSQAEKFQSLVKTPVKIMNPGDEMEFQ